VNFERHDYLFPNSFDITIANIGAGAAFIFFSVISNTHYFMASTNTDPLPKPAAETASRSTFAPFHPQLTISMG
jgi:hypothetical protein